MASRPYQISFSPTALEELIVAKTWWRRHRSANPSLFEIEVEQALLMLGNSPEIGVRIPSRRHGDLRCVQLRRSGYLLFYQVVPAQLEAIVVHLRHGRRRPLRAR